MPVTSHEDMVGGELTTELAGSQFEYQYSTGNHYRITFVEAGVRFEMLEGANGEAPPPPIDPHGNPVDVLAPLPYRARKLRDDLFLVHWILRPGIHVSLVLDLGQQRVHVAAMMPPNQWEFFDVAEMIAVSRDGS